MTASRIHTLKIWLKVFIPGDWDMAKPVPAGAHQGKTMIISPPGVGTPCYLTDNRGFSDDPDAPSRMHSEVTLTFGESITWEQAHQCYETIEINCQTGEETCRDRGNTDAMQFSDFALEGDTLSLHLSGSSHNPCFKVVLVEVSPNVDYEGTLTLTLSEDGSAADITFDGLIETYPCFEMYASVNGGAGQAVFRMEVEPGSRLTDLVGGPRREVYQKVRVKA